MKIEWQADDIRCGRRIGKAGRGEQWMIGYLADRPPAEKVRYVLVSLNDGMVACTLSAEAMALHLNATGDVPLEMLNGEGRSKGGHARAASLSPSRRSEIASVAATARWNGAQSSGEANNCEQDEGA